MVQWTILGRQLHVAQLVLSISFTWITSKTELRLLNQVLIFHNLKFSNFQRLWWYSSRLSLLRDYLFLALLPQDFFSAHRVEYSCVLLHSFSRAVHWGTSSKSQLGWIWMCFFVCIAFSAIGNVFQSRGPTTAKKFSYRFQLAALALLVNTQTPHFQMVQWTKVDISLKQFTKPRPWIIYSIST